MFADTQFAGTSRQPAAAMLNAQGTKLHHLKSSKDQNNEKEALIAFPNDRARSIRPSNQQESYQ